MSDGRIEFTLMEPGVAIHSGGNSAIVLYDSEVNPVAQQRLSYVERAVFVARLRAMADVLEGVTGND